MLPLYYNQIILFNWSLPVESSSCQRWRHSHTAFTALVLTPRIHIPLFLLLTHLVPSPSHFPLEWFIYFILFCTVIYFYSLWLGAQLCCSCKMCIMELSFTLQLSLEILSSFSYLLAVKIDFAVKLSMAVYIMCLIAIKLHIFYCS